MVYVCTSFRGHWPVGTAAVVVEKDAAAAARALESELAKQGLAQDIKPSDMQVVKTRNMGHVMVLCDGDY